MRHQAKRAAPGQTAAAIDGAVVEMVSMAEFAVGLLVMHDVSEGFPPHDTEIVDPVKLANVRVVEPEPPGEAMTTVVGFAVTEGGGVVITMEKFEVAVAGMLCASATMMVKLDVPPAVGVPEIVPVAALSCNPPGKLLPGATDHVYGLIPPVAVRVAE